MKVIRSKVLGFCSGVSRAVKMAEDALEQNSSTSKKIYSLGPLIHNDTALADLEKRGLSILDEKEIPSLDKNCVVIIRAHGVAPSVLEKIKATGAAVIDATCPRVSLNCRRAAEFAQKGYTVILAGDAGHAEVKAVMGNLRVESGELKVESGKWIVENFLLVENAERVERLFTGENQKLLEGRAVLLSQTTFSIEEFQKIAATLKEKLPNLEVLDTICLATQRRQDALQELAANVDAVVVIGGKKSANTRRLYELARTFCKHAFFVENARELKIENGELKIIGITAGASTPDFVIDEVEKMLLQRGD